MVTVAQVGNYTSTIFAITNFIAVIIAGTAVYIAVTRYLDIIFTFLMSWYAEREVFVKLLLLCYLKDNFGEHYSGCKIGQFRMVGMEMREKRKIL